MQTALYRKYRPLSFRDVLGQDAVREALKNQIASGRFGHSYIFTGIRGTGKTTLARILAKAVNCPDAKDGEPCGVCDICRGVDDGTMLDVTEIDAASNNGVDNMRELREETAFAPNVCKYRVYIIDEAHMLSKDAWGALLKIMEEPPPHVIFILATTEIHKVPATILSRCQRYDLRRVPKSEIIGLLLRIAEAENISLSADGAACIARLSDGAVRDALSLLDTSASLGGEIDAGVVSRLAGVADKSYLASLTGDIARGDAGALFVDLRALYESSIDPVRLCYELLRRFRDLLALALAGESALEDGSLAEPDALRAELKLFTPARLLAILDELSSTADKLAFAPDRTLALELALVRLCGAAQTPSPQQSARAQTPPAKTVSPPTADKSAPPPESAPQAAAREVREAVPDGAGDSFNETGDDPPWDEPEAAAEVKKPAAPEAAPQAQPPAAADDAPNDGEDELRGDENEDDDLFENVKRSLSAAPAPDKALLAPTKSDAPSPAPDGLENFERWGEALEAIRRECPMIYGFLDRSRAYLDGAKLLIGDNNKFFVIKDDRAKLAEIERVVRETTGLALRVSAYEPPESSAKGGAAAELDDLFERAELHNITIDEITSQQ